MAALKVHQETVRAPPPHYVYYRHSSLPEQTTEWLQLHIREVIEACDVKDGDHIKILSVGSGQGDPDMVILDNILELDLPVQYTVIEPNSREAAKFESHVMGKPKYSKAYHDLLEKKGCMLAITAANSGGWGGVIDQYKNTLPMADFSNEEDVESVLERNRWSVKRDMINFTLDITPLFADDEPGNALLDFMTGVHEARKVLPHPLIQGILDQLVKMARKEDNQYYIINPMWVHIIRK